MSLNHKKYYEVKPGPDMLRYLFEYAFVSRLAKRAKKRDFRMFAEVTSNIDRHILTEGLFEKGVIDLLVDLIEVSGQRRRMIDIGANIGNHTVALAPLFDKVDSVEPHPVLFRVMMANVIRNRFTHVTGHNFGLASEDATATLAEPLENHAISRIKERSQLSPEVFGFSNEQFGEEFAVDLKNAREWVSQFAGDLSESFIKIDVEGMEQEIVTALRPLLEEHHPLVGFEWFTKAQPELTDVVLSIPGYALWGIRMHDMGTNFAWRATKLLFTGRSYTLERIDPDRLDPVYPLALLVPDKVSAKLG